MNNEARIRLGKRIKEKREKLKISQTELAKSVHKSSPAYIAFIESGDRNVSAMDLMLIAKSLGTTVSELMDEGNNKNIEVMQALRADKSLSEKERNEINNYYLWTKNKKNNEK